MRIFTLSIVRHKNLILAFFWCGALIAIIITGVFFIQDDAASQSWKSLTQRQNLLTYPQNAFSDNTFLGEPPPNAPVSAKLPELGILTSNKNTIFPITLGYQHTPRDDYSFLLTNKNKILSLINNHNKAVDFIYYTGGEVDPLLLATLDPAWIKLINRLAADGFDLACITGIFAAFGNNSFSPDFMSAKITELFGVGSQYIKVRMDEGLLPEDYSQPVPEVTFANCLYFMDQYKKNLDEAYEIYGVPADILVSILLVETGLGTNLGNYSALQALASMAATTTPQALSSLSGYKQVRSIPHASLQRALTGKSEWAYNELKALLTHAINNKKQIHSLPGSMYGAVGLCQFMPSNIDLFGVDGDGDGVIDLFSPIDALHSVGNYLYKNGWNNSASKERKMRVIFSYNHDMQYVSNVMAVANQLSLARKGKVAALSSPLRVASYGKGQKYLDRYLSKRRRYVPAAGRIKGLGNYGDLLN